MFNVPFQTQEPETTTGPVADGEEGGWWQAAQRASGYTGAREAAQREADETQQAITDLAEAATVLAGGIVAGSLIVGTVLWYKSR